MSKTVIFTHQAPNAIGPYSQGIQVGPFVYTSGQIPLDPATGVLISDDIKNATRQSLENLKAILAASGCTMEDVVKTTVLLKNLEDFAAVNEVYATYFQSKPPARSCFEVARLPMDALIEIEAIAYQPS